LEIIIRASGERTEKDCIKSCEQQGNVHIIRAFPFGESIRQTYELAMTFRQEWIPVIDADVVLDYGTLVQGTNEVKLTPGCRGKLFCYDGKTDDKIMMNHRRAGVHIYRTSLLEIALKYIDNTQLKPESHIRRQMAKQGFPTFTGKTIFGTHDHNQYYKDLWRKSVCQTKKLERMIQKYSTRDKWQKLARTDKDYKVILAAHDWALKNNPEIIIDSRIDYDAEEQVKKLGLVEKI